MRRRAHDIEEIHPTAGGAGETAASETQSRTHELDCPGLLCPMPVYFAFGGQNDHELIAADADVNLFT